MGTVNHVAPGATPGATTEATIGDPIVRRLDITDEVCPLTFVKAKLPLGRHDLGRHR